MAELSLRARNASFQYRSILRARNASFQYRSLLQACCGTFHILNGNFRQSNYAHLVTAAFRFPRTPKCQDPECSDLSVDSFALSGPHLKTFQTIQIPGTAFQLPGKNIAALACHGVGSNPRSERSPVVFSTQAQAQNLVELVQLAVSMCRGSYAITPYLPGQGLKYTI